MPSWLMRLIWKVRGKRIARLHLAGDLPSLEGILVGCWSGHYVLLQPKVIETSDRTVALEGTVEVPRERVVFVQVLG